MYFFFKYNILLILDKYIYYLVNLNFIYFFFCKEKYIILKYQLIYVFVYYTEKKNVEFKCSIY